MMQFLEAVMVLCFGLSWPAPIYRSYKGRTARGKSLFFLCMLGLGYVCGIVAKFLHLAQEGTLPYPTYFYCANLLMISVEILLYFRNRRLDKATENQ